VGLRGLEPAAYTGASIAAFPWRTPISTSILNRKRAAFAFTVALAGVTPAAAQPSPPSSGPIAFDPANRDTTCAPCRDFYQYANGAWLARATIPAAYSSYGSFRMLRDQNERALRDILESVASRSDKAAGSNSWKLAAYYRTCTDSLGAEKAGLEPIQPELDRIAKLKSKKDLGPQVARMQSQGIATLFRFGSEQDAKNSTRVIAGTGQGGLGLPDRDYYTKGDSVSQQLRTAYVAHIARTFELLGRPRAAAATEAERVMGIETALAKASMTNVQRRDPKAVYHKMRVEDLRALAPDFDWKTYLSTLELASVDSLNVAQPDFFKAVQELMTRTPLEDWQAYLRWKVADDAAPVLSDAFVQEDFSFQKRLTGAKELLPRWRRCLLATDQALGEALGIEYVNRHFPADAKTRALDMVQQLEGALEARLATLAWMSSATRVQATSKLQAFYEKIGYPDRWRDYSSLKLEDGPFAVNRQRARAFEVRRQLAKIGKPVDRTEWAMTPPTVNAYYSSSMNSINFPAGILQPPFFDPKADDAINYGGIGAVIGHEMTHGFDDRGRQFDADGNLRDWWTAEDAASYKGRAQLIADQFSGYVAVDSLHVNGKLTLGENIADLGGLTVAYAALERSMQGKPRPKSIDGLTPEQRFFLSWATVWRERVRPEQSRTLALTNTHSPGRWRVNGPLSNMPEFARAFGCKAGDPMVRPDSLQAQIW
jgi:putative endopeptidase